MSSQFRARVRTRVDEPLLSAMEKTSVCAGLVPSRLLKQERQKPEAKAINGREAMKKANLIALAKTMISTSFPALRGLTLKLKMVDTDDFVMAVWIEDREIHLEVSREDAARMGQGVVTGVLAHELCHAEEDRRHGPFLETLFSWFCERIPSLKTRMERRIDIAVIRKGYGNELLAFQRYHDEYYEPYDQSDGMTVKEIEEALRRSS